MARQTIPISEFKAKCLKILADLQKNGGEIIVTKNGQPLAKVTPSEQKPRTVGDLMGKYRDRIKVLVPDEELIYFDTSEDWEALK